jgi:lipase (class 3)
VKRLDGFDVVVLRGSVTLQDWLRDAQALAMPSRIGHVHSGFYAGMEHMWTDLKAMLSQPAIVTGHSLGAARAAVLTALMTVDGVPPVARVVFGEPKPGLLDFAKLITGIPGRSYRNGDSTHHDLITDVPLSFPPMQFVQPCGSIGRCAGSCRKTDHHHRDRGLDVVCVRRHSPCASPAEAAAGGGFPCRFLAEDHGSDLGQDPSVRFRCHRG